jgi:hypothetical protein
LKLSKTWVSYIPRTDSDLLLQFLSVASAGLKFKEVAKPTVWHPEVQQYAVTDAETGERMGYFYLDLHPR